jgi:hypothetical protein
MAPTSAKAQGPINLGLHFVTSGHCYKGIQINVLEFIRHDPIEGDERSPRIQRNFLDASAEKPKSF